MGDGLRVMLEDLGLNEMRRVNGNGKGNGNESTIELVGNASGISGGGSGGFGFFPAAVSGSASGPGPVSASASVPVSASGSASMFKQTTASTKPKPKLVHRPRSMTYRGVESAIRTSTSGTSTISTSILPGPSSSSISGIPAPRTCAASTTPRMHTHTGNVSSARALAAARIASLATARANAAARLANLNLSSPPLARFAAIPASPVSEDGSIETPMRMEGVIGREAPPIEGLRAPFQREESAKEGLERIARVFGDAEESPDKKTFF
jgi:hypothetical protein